jgi:dTDP-4-amino-4,6-dideoxygalactose transaminase
MEVIERRRQIAQAYHDTLNKYPDVRLPPPPNECGKNFDIFQNYEFCTMRRDDLRKFLRDNGVGTIIQWGGFGVHMLENLGMKTDLPITDKFFKESLLLPLNHVMSDQQIEYVCQLLDKFFSGGLND